MNGISNVHVSVVHVDVKFIHHVVLNSEEAHEFIRLDASTTVGIGNLLHLVLLGW